MKRTTLLRPSIDAYMSLVEAAQRLGVTKQTLLNWIWARKLAAQKFGQQYMVLRDDIETLKQKREARTWSHVPEEIRE